MSARWPSLVAGVLADVWAALKFVVAAVFSPFGVVLVGWRAMVNHAAATAEVGRFPARVAALDAGRPLTGDDDRVRRLSADEEAFVTSDLHRCYPGRRDVAAQQDTKGLYAAVLRHYEQTRHHVVENGDVEDYWVVGGSPYGQWYDAARVATDLVALLPVGWAGQPRRALLRRHRRLIEANNPDVSTVVARLGRSGRYHRTVGNHDDVLLDRALAADVARTAGGADPVDHIVLERTDGRAAAVITHGHQTDGWNSQGRSGLGRLATWVSNTISDVPGLETPDLQLLASTTVAYLQGRLPNRLLQVSTRFGANAKYDSLDEELLFDAFGGAAHNGPWILLGHTHLPVLQPLSRTGVPWHRYANSGNGIWAGMVTGMEWPGGDEASPRAVAWVLTDVDGVAPLIPPGAVTVPVGERTAARLVMRRRVDGAALEVDPVATTAGASAVATTVTA